jgi:hypothetical protein
MRTTIAIALLAVAVTCAPVQAQQTPQWWNLNGIGTDRPSARQNAAMAPSPDGDIVLFGGTGASGDLHDTWVFTIQGWIQKGPAPSPPSMRWARMVYDSWRRRSVMVGYSSDTSNSGPQTWFWDGEKWTSLDGPSALRAEPGFSLAFDEVRGDVVLFGGYASGAAIPCLDDTWVLDGGTQWKWVAGSQQPGPLLHAGAARASATSASPPARVYGATAYDKAWSRIVLHGGVDQCDTGGSRTLTDTWVWDGSARTWTDMQPANHPPANDQGYQLAYYGLGNYLVAAGCNFDSCNMYAPTALYEWDGSNWSSIPGPGLQDPTKPWTAPRADGGLALSEVPGYGGLLLFGGYDITTLLDETWAWGTLPEILNTAPTAVIIGPPNGVVACSVPTGTPVTLDGRQSSDAENQPLTYLWTGPFGSRTSSVVEVPLPIGSSKVTLTVSDGKLEGSASQSVIVAVGVQGLESPLGPLTPIGAPPPTLPTVFSKAGSTLPLKLVLTCGPYALTKGDVAAPILLDVKPVGSTASSVDIHGVFRTQGTTWIYNLQTKALVPGVYELLIEMPDTLVYRALIGLR